MIVATLFWLIVFAFIWMSEISYNYEICGTVSEAPGENYIFDDRDRELVCDYLWRRN